jgi:hypothetical protein
MVKDLIIGGASNYTWEQLKYWVNSIKRSGFDGDIMLVSSNFKKDTIDKLTAEGVLIYLFGEIQSNGDVINKNETKMPASVERFFYVWHVLKKYGSNYRYVISTDTRDVVFQENPSLWLERNLHNSERGLVAPSEGLKYEEEPWNNNNLYQGYGPHVYDFYKGMCIYNVGVLAGTPEHMRDIFFMTFQMSAYLPIIGVDQAAFNIVINQEPFKLTTMLTSHKNAWVAQLGTTIQAINSVSGDLGLQIMKDPTAFDKYLSNYQDTQPQINDEGIVLNSVGEKFAIVHQYDRISAWKDKIMRRYE